MTPDNVDRIAGPELGAVPLVTAISLELGTPFVIVKKTPFARDKWTHVVMSFSGVNTEGKDTAAKLYLDGKLQGTLKDRRQVFTWDLEKANIRLGLSYIGLFDDLAIFDRALSDEEVQKLYELPKGVGRLHARK